jgi:uncharacterized membrane protein YfcA
MDISNIMLLLMWGALVGLVFSSIGAAGGILASFGLITIIGVTDPNSVKPMAQILALATALVFIPGYFKRKAWVLEIGLMLSAGGVIGALVGSTISSRYLSDMSSFKPLFGILAFLVAVQITWKLYHKSKTGKPTVARSDAGVDNVFVSWKTISFDYGGKKYQCSFWSPLFAGFIIAVIASIFGVGGGFLLVPYLASMLEIPMFIVPATAALAVLISGVISVTNYIRLGSEIDIPMLFILVIGGVLGAKIGPIINQMMKESWLQASLACIVAVIGTKYILT